MVPGHNLTGIAKKIIKLSFLQMRTKYGQQTVDVALCEVIKKVGIAHQGSVFNLSVNIRMLKGMTRSSVYDALSILPLLLKAHCY